MIERRVYAPVRCGLAAAFSASEVRLSGRGSGKAVEAGAGPLDLIGIVAKASRAA
jgi:hypothetical protein